MGHGRERLDLRLGKRFTGFAGFNVFKLVTEGGSATSIAGSDAVTWMLRVNGTAELTPTLSLQGVYMYRAPMKIERGRFSKVQITNFSLRKKIDGDKASVTLRVQDPFRTNKFRVQAGTSTLMQITERNPGVRGAFLTFQYNYGQPPRVRQPQQDQPQQGGGGFGG